jgi:hypothetical protein
MSDDLEIALEALVRRAPRCATFVSKLRASDDPARVLDVLTDRPREPVFRALTTGGALISSSVRAAAVDQHVGRCSGRPIHRRTPTDLPASPDSVSLRG